MLLKTYTGPDLASALVRARSEMGPDALVLASQEIEGGLGLRAWEVTVAAKRATPRARFDAAEAPPAEREPDPLHPTVLAAAHALVEAGLAPSLAARVARSTAESIGKAADPDGIFRAASRGLAALVPVSTTALHARCLFVVGPPGAGKTTTAAKLAARGALAACGTTLLAESDLDRVGAIEEAAILSHHLGARLARLEGPEDLRRAMKDAGRDGRIVVDTPGVGRADDGRISRIAALRAAAPEAEVAILLPSGLRREEAALVLERFDAIRPTAVAFSRVDESPFVGELVSAVAERGLPLAFVTDGHRVPDDLEAADPGRLLARLIRGGMRPARPEDTR